MAEYKFKADGTTWQVIADHGDVVLARHVKRGGQLDEATGQLFHKSDIELPEDYDAEALDSAE